MLNVASRLYGRGRLSFHASLSQSQRGYFFIMDFQEFVSHAVGLLEFLGILVYIRYGFYFMLASAGTFAFVKLLSGAK